MFLLVQPLRKQKRKERRHRQGLQCWRSMLFAITLNEPDIVEAPTDTLPMAPTALVIEALAGIQGQSNFFCLGADCQQQALTVCGQIPKTPVQKQSTPEL